MEIARRSASASIDLFIKKQKRERIGGGDDDLRGKGKEEEGANKATTHYNATILRSERVGWVPVRKGRSGKRGFSSRWHLGREGGRLIS